VGTVAAEIGDRPLPRSARFIPDRVINSRGVPPRAARTVRRLVDRQCRWSGSVRASDCVTVVSPTVIRPPLTTPLPGHCSWTHGRIRSWEGRQAASGGFVETEKERRTSSDKWSASSGTRLRASTASEPWGTNGDGRLCWRRKGLVRLVAVMGCVDIERDRHRLGRRRTSHLNGPDAYISVRVEAHFVAIGRGREIANLLVRRAGMGHRRP
jgi:hypothetical protein